MRISSSHPTTTEASRPNNSSGMQDRAIRVATSYNAVACKLIGHGDYDRSIKLITSAIRLFKTASGTTEHIMREEREKKSNYPPRSVDAFMTSFPSSVGVVGREGHQCRDEDEGSGKKAGDDTKHGNRCGSHENVTAYRRPIQLPVKDDHVGDQSDSSSMMMLPPILFFNLALAYHLRGIKNKRNDFLKKAVTLYENSFRFERIRCQSRNLFASPLLLASILNNIGHIQQSLLQDDVAASTAANSSSSPTSPDVYFQRLFTMLTYLVQVRRISQSQYSGFFENCVAGMSLRNSIRCASAA
eukprot:CAMPEP_0117019906 /NCGR_PEP_ID=MMETSP0472-20121206/15201_1 /TAXON_ID=693140 ORGANISM="Tiarina fusus, Strain LIS" /NCGR_SAMPLE_ID=MMETSP0472 /ASSEMBLY_ACC=CAM_ASM_000603 /LENGTH=299 /DNA_ID=CAMNT_0004724973 /DNA_START=164 /DNA_END=1063 /DNA_ORIENTATION=+